LIFLAVAVVVYSLVSTQMEFSGIKGTLWERTWGNFGGWIILIGVFAAFLIVGQLISRRSRVRKSSRR
jgi:hypothetical protein